jgi:predicted dehydrogenase
MNELKKLFRYFIIYGISRTIIKVAGRTKFIFLKYFFINLFIQKNRVISLIGAGQFGFSTISFYLQKNRGKVFLDCYDINIENMRFTSRFYNYNEVLSLNNLFNNSNCKIVYIASNHSTHMDYAISCIKNNLIVYIEKPLVVNYEQLIKFYQTIRLQKNYKIFLGFNRPFSPAILKLNHFLNKIEEPLSLNFFIIGHKINENHWYHDPKEGTRICGNVAHWIDLMVNLMNTRGKIPNHYSINITYTTNTIYDDNFIITINTDYKDIISIFFTTRSEPFEGVNETINLQCANIISKIDDFRTLQIWDQEYYYKNKYFYKNVGHENAILQPFSNNNCRNFLEIEISTIIMLEISEMIIKNERTREFDAFVILNKLKIA